MIRPILKFTLLITATVALFAGFSRPASAEPGWVCYGDSDCGFMETCLMPNTAGCCWPNLTTFTPSNANAAIARMKGKGPLAEKLRAAKKPLPRVSFAKNWKPEQNTNKR